MSGERKQKKPRKRSLTADRSRGGAERSRGDDRACIKSHRRADPVSAGGDRAQAFPPSAFSIPQLIAEGKMLIALDVLQLLLHAAMLVVLFRLIHVLKK